MTHSILTKKISFFVATIPIFESVPIAVEITPVSRRSKPTESVVGRFVAVEDAKLWHLD